MQLATFGTGFKIFFWGYVVHTFPQVIPAGRSLPGSPSSLWENQFGTGALWFKHSHKKPLSPKPRTGYIGLSLHHTSRFGAEQCGSVQSGAVWLFAVRCRVLNQTSGITSSNSVSTVYVQAPMLSLCMCATQWHTNAMQTWSHDRVARLQMGPRRRGCTQQGLRHSA